MKYDNKFDNECKAFFKEYKELCINHGIMFVSNEKTAKSMCFTTVPGSEYSFVNSDTDDFATFDEFCEEVDKFFFDKCD